MTTLSPFLPKDLMMNLSELTNCPQQKSSINHSALLYFDSCTSVEFSSFDFHYSHEDKEIPCKEIFFPWQLLPQSSARSLHDFSFHVCANRIFSVVPLRNMLWGKLSKLVVIISKIMVWLFRFFWQHGYKYLPFHYH